MRFYLDGNELPAPVEWQDIEFTAQFNDFAAVPSLDISQLTFVNEAYYYIVAHIDKGLIFTPIQLRIEINTFIFSAVLDLSDGYKQIYPNKLQASIKDLNGINLLSERLEGITYGLLLDEQIINDEDYTEVPIIVVKQFDATDVAMLSIASYILIKDLQEFIKESAKQKGQLAKGTTDPREAIFGILITIITIAYYAVLVVALIQMIREVLTQLIPQRSMYKGMTLRRLMEKALQRLNYTFESTIPELEWVYLPSKINETVRLNKQETGIPRIGDYGYICKEIFELAKSLFKAQYKIEGNKLILEPEISDFWENSSNYQLPDVLLESKEYNANELRANRLYSFLTDSADTYTTTEWRGTNYEIINKSGEMLKGSEEVRWNVALGKTKEKFTALEVAINFFIKSANSITAKLGGAKTDLIDFGANRIKISQPFTEVPKLISLKDGKPTKEITAKKIVDKYHFEADLQYELYKGLTIPFNEIHLQSLLQNSYFNYLGKRAKIDSFKWVASMNKAIVDFRIEKIYTELTTRKIEP